MKESLAHHPTIDLSADRMLAVCFTAVGFVGLLIGSVGYDPRLVVSGVPLNPILYILLTLPLLFTIRRSEVKLALLYVTPFFALAPSLFFGYDQSYGLFKFGNLLCVQLFCTLYWMQALRLGGVRLLLQFTSLILLLLMLLALVYKLRYGFFDRQVPYFMNGPIVFGRLMGLGAILAFFLYRGPLRYLLASLFFFGVVWSASKGPILATVLILTLIVWNTFSIRGRVAFFAVTMCIVAVGVSYINAFGAGSANRVVVLIDLLTMNRESLEQSASIGVRVFAYFYSWDMVEQWPFGVGLGSWSLFVEDSFGLEYPHNLFLELFSESGLLLGAIASVPFWVMLFCPRSEFKTIAIFFLIVQQVSGDLLDARYISVYGLLAVWVSVRTNQANGLKPRIDACARVSN